MELRCTGHQTGCNDFTGHAPDVFREPPRLKFIKKDTGSLIRFSKFLLQLLRREIVTLTAQCANLHSRASLHQARNASTSISSCDISSSGGSEVRKCRLKSRPKWPSRPQYYLLEDTENTRWLKVRKRRKLMSSLSPPLDCGLTELTAVINENCTSCATLRKRSANAIWGYGACSVLAYRGIGASWSLRDFVR